MNLTLRNFLYEQEEGSGIKLTPSQAKGVSSILARLGLDPEGVVGTPEKSVGSEVELDEASKTNISTNIPEKGVELAREFYEAGKKGGEWYYEAAKTLAANFPDEQERVLFSLLLAATSVQNEIYTNFIEAAVLFNALSRDSRDNIDLLTQWAYDPKAPGMDHQKVKNSPYGQLNIYKDALNAKIINLGAKYPNISKAVQLWLQGNLTKQAVRNLIASSVELVSPTSFDSKSPFFRKLKIANFALTLVDPEFASTEDNWFNVVVDTWMFRAFYPGVTKDEVAYLFGQDSAYANVSRVVSDLAKEAGVSPHVMQAAIWLGIKQKTEGEEGGVPDYLAAVAKLVKDYSQLWKEMGTDTSNLKKVITSLDTGIAKDAIKGNRGDIMRARVAKETEKKRVLKAKQALQKDREEKAKEAERVSAVMNKMRRAGLRLESFLYDDDAANLDG